MEYIYIGFDEYYDIEQYNEFLVAAKNNKVKFEEFLSIKPPHQRFLWIDKDNLPNFLNYDEATESEKRWLISTVKPVLPNEAYKLYRRPGEDIKYLKYITPKPLENLKNEDYIMVFKAFDYQKIQKISKKLGKSKIFKWGRAEKKGYNIYFCFNPYIKNYVESSEILLEYGLENKPMPDDSGELEYRLNYKILVREKLLNKTYNLPYHSNGKYNPLNRTTFL